MNLVHLLVGSDLASPTCDIIRTYDVIMRATKTILLAMLFAIGLQTEFMSQNI